MSFFLCLLTKKKVPPPGDRKKPISVFRVFFEQKKSRVRVPVFEPRSGNTRETGTRRHTGTKEKSDRDNYNNNNNNNTQ